MKKEKKYVGILTTYADDELTRDDYKEFCEINDIEEGDDDAFEEWKRDGAYRTWDDDMDNLGYIMTEEEFVITGSVGRWDGRRTIMPVRIKALRNAIKRCISGCYMDVEVKLNTESGIIEFDGHHHDGTDSFEIHRMSKNGIRWWDYAEECDEPKNICKRWFKKINRKEIWG